jgi:hypothetical protein
MRICIHIISVVALATALYFASVLDLETRFVPRKIAYPLVDRRSSQGNLTNQHLKIQRLIKMTPSNF